MKSGYKIYWTDYALNELEKTIEFLEENWTEKEIRKLVLNLEETISIISRNPFIFQVSEIKPEIRRAVILRYNTFTTEFNLVTSKYYRSSQTVKIQRKES